MRGSSCAPRKPLNSVLPRAAAPNVSALAAQLLGVLPLALDSYCNLVEARCSSRDVCRGFTDRGLLIIRLRGSRPQEATAYPS